MHSVIGTSTAPRHTCCADCPPALAVHSTRPSSSMFPQMWNRPDNPCRFPHPTCRPPFRFPLFTLECARGLNTSIVPSKLIFAADTSQSGGPALRPEPARVQEFGSSHPLSSILSFLSFLQICYCRAWDPAYNHVSRARLVLCSLGEHQFALSYDVGGRFIHLHYRNQPSKFIGWVLR
jgi:hypothetical protein